MLKKITSQCLAAVLLLGMAWTPAPPPPAASPADGIAAIIEKYRQEIPQRMQQEAIPGLAIAIVDDQEILWIEGFGYTDWDKRTPVTPDTLFSIQSMSKSFTATAAMFAAQDGLVDLDAPITAYLPEFHINSIFETHPEKQITLRRLLSHTAGFAHEAPYGGNFDNPPYSFERHIDSISQTWLRSPVGTRYDYSNLGVDLAGYILQVRSGMPFIRYVQEKVLDPLGMSGSTLDVSRVRASAGRAIGHTPIPLRPPADPLIIPSGGVSTTAQDMARYLQFHINKGAIDGTRLLSEDLAETMYTPPSQAALDGGYALGIGVGTRNGARHFQHGGGGFGFNSSMVWYPELKLGSVVLTNSEQPDAYYYHLSEDVLDSIIASAPTLYAQRAGSAVQAAPAYPPSQDATVLSNNGLAALIKSKALPVDAAAQSRRQTYVGSYLLTMWGIPAITAEISARDDDLYFSALGASGPLTEVEPGLFFTPGGDTFDARGLFPTALNIRLVKENPGALPITIAFYALCGLIFLSTLLFWPVRAGIRRLRRKGVQAAPAARNPWLTWTAILAGLASLFSLFCLALIALVPGLVSVPWPRPYEDLLPWQFGALSLPFVCLLLGVLIALLAGPLTRSRAWDALTRYYYLIVALALLAFNLAIIT